MKKKIILLSILFILIFSLSSYTETINMSIYINNNRVNFSDMEPFIDENSRTLVPVRAISENLDSYVKWDGENKEVIIVNNNVRIRLKINSKKAIVNGNEVIMDTQAQLYNNRCVVPLRFISEALDFKVNYQFTNDYRLDNKKRGIIDIEAFSLKLSNELRKMNNNEIDISKYNINVSDMEGLSEAMIDEFPDLYFLDQFNYSYIDDKVISIKFIFKDKVEGLEKEYESFVNKCDLILDKIIDNNMSDYEKEKAIHNYLVENVEYDINMKYPIKSHTAYGAIMNNLAVCDGYAESFDYLLKRVGIPSKLVYGKLENELHAWNLVNIDNKEYFVDVTSDDPLNNKNKLMSYDYFNIPYYMIKNTHSFEKDYSSINNIDDNYFYRNGILFKKQSDAEKYITSQLNKNNGQTRLNFALTTEIKNSNINIEAIIEKYIKENLDKFTGEYSYLTRHDNESMVFDMVISIKEK